MSDAVAHLIKTHMLSSHPEGGWYRETYRSKDVVETPNGPRPLSTAILYMLHDSDVSRFHRIDADELWFYHSGSAINVVCLEEGEGAVVHRIDADNPQLLVKAGTWFGAALAVPHGYGMGSCVVSPGFDFAGFEMADREELLAKWPEDAAWIERLT